VIYADNAATTRISDSVFEKMLPFLREQYGNASSQYSLGVKAKRAVEMARKQVAIAINADPAEITFTSGGSEANSWVILHVAGIHCNEPVHMITSAIEHHSVLNTCHTLEQNGIEITYLPIDRSGRVSAEDIKAATKPHTKLVSIMLANNEIGTIQPIAEIGQLLRERGILFHTDAVQAVGHISVDVKELQIDFLAASAHKFNGAKGTGILYKRTGVGIAPMVFGGKQEHGLRAGTENVAGIVSAGYAIEESTACLQAEKKRLEAMIEATVKGIQARIPTVRINGDFVKRLPGVINLGFDDMSGEALMHLLDLKGVCISTSSACTSGNSEPSHVLIALGLTESMARSAIRISYGKCNSPNDVSAIVTAICDAYAKIKMNQ